MPRTDKASAEVDRMSERIWVTVKSDDFSGTVMLDYNGAQSLLGDLESCTEEVRLRRERAAEKVKP